MKYILELELSNDRVLCLDCPIKDSEDNCVLQEGSNKFHSWEEQLVNCPLVEVK